MRCHECGYQSIRWLGRCPGCGSWDSFQEEQPQPASKIGRSKHKNKPIPISEIIIKSDPRETTGMEEVDRVLGSGFVPGSVVLLGGDPGIGKSTLALQIAHLMASAGKPVLYASGEESLLQIRLRAERLGLIDTQLQIVAETDVEALAEFVSESKPQLLVLDSIQTFSITQVAAAPGSLGQVRDCTLYLSKIAKSLGITVFIIGHVTKEGVLAGPRTLEHMVDTVLYLEGDRQHSYRILRGVKNRYGSTNEIGVFEMNPSGLVPVDNPSQLFLGTSTDEVPGSAVVPCIEGTRPLLVEIQALVGSSAFGNPRRLTTGLDYNRVVLMTAVLEKKVGLGLSGQDVYVSAVGGVRINEPAADLAIAAALVSSFKDRAVPRGTALVGEIGLTGEIRPVSFMDKRLLEASKLGFTRVIMPKGSGHSYKTSLSLIPVQDISEALTVLF